MHFPVKAQNRRLTVLSLGFTRELWEDPGNAQGDTFPRLVAYSRYISAYHVVTHSLKRHNLPTPRKIADKFWAYATNGYTRIDSWLRMLCLGIRISRKYAPDVIQAQDPLFTGSAAYILSQVLNIPYNICVYGSNPFDYYWVNESAIQRIGSMLARRVLFCANGIQVDGCETKGSLIRSGIDEHGIALKPVIPRNISEFLSAKTDPELRRALSDDGRYTWLFLFAGRVAPQKNLGLLLQVAARVAVERGDVRFVCVGDGPDRRALEEETHRLGLTDTVIWTGAKPHGEIIRYMATCDAFVLTSRYEGFARVIMEASAAGRPVITTAVSGSDDGVIHKKTGFITPVDDVGAFVSAVTDLMSDRDRAGQMGRAGRHNIQSLIDHYMNPYLQIDIWERIVHGS